MRPQWLNRQKIEIWKLFLCFLDVLSTHSTLLNSVHSLHPLRYSLAEYSLLVLHAAAVHRSNKLLLFHHSSSQYHSLVGHHLLKPHSLLFFISSLKILKLNLKTPLPLLFILFLSYLLIFISQSLHHRYFPLLSFLVILSLVFLSPLLLVLFSYCLTLNPIQVFLIQSLLQIQLFLLLLLK